MSKIGKRMILAVNSKNSEDKRQKYGEGVRSTKGDAR